MDDLTTRVIEAATDAVRAYPRHVRKREDLVEAVRLAAVRELERPVILGRFIDDDTTPNEELLIDALSGLPADRFKRIADEALGRRDLALDLAIIELEGMDPDA